MSIPAIPVCLTIAGSDSGGGAGIQADLRTFHCCGAYGASVLTAVTAQNPKAVVAIHPIPPPDVRAQLRAVFGALRVRAAKTGMLFAAPVIELVAAEMDTLAPDLPLVVDPVMVATSGARLLQEDAIVALRTRLLPRATLITPNLPEAELLLGRPLPDAVSVRAGAKSLATQMGAAVLLKGGHRGTGAATDCLALEGRLFELSTPRLTVAATHGTGCTLSAAITAHLAQRLDLLTAVVAAKAFVYHSLRAARTIGPGCLAMVPPTRCDTSVVQFEELGTAG